METEGSLSGKGISKFCESLKISPVVFTEEEIAQTEQLEGEIAGLNRQIAGKYRDRTEIRKQVLMRLELVAYSPEMLTTQAGNAFGGRVKDDLGFRYVRRDGETAFHCGECQVWMKAEPRVMVFVDQQVAAYNCPLGEHPMGKGQFPFMVTLPSGSSE